MDNFYNYDLINLDAYEFTFDEENAQEYNAVASVDYDNGEDEFPDVSDEFSNPESGYGSRQELENHVRDVAARRNITLAVRSSKPRSGNKGASVLLVCSQGLDYRSNKKKFSRETSTQKGMCPFRIIGKEYVTAVGDGRWWVRVKMGRHNHPFPHYAEGSRLGQLKPHEYDAIREQELQMLPPSDMLASLKRADPGNVTNLARVYNAVAKIRKEKRGNRTPLENFLLLLQDHNYIFDYRLSDSSTLGDVVFSHPASKAMLNAYPQVIIINNVYICLYTFMK